MKEENPVEMNKPILILLGSLMFVLIFVLIYFSIPFSNEEDIFEVETGINPARGDVNAKIKIIEFSDFQCPACKAAEPIINEIINKYGNNIVFYYRNFPLKMHENSFIAAEAAECANEQGKFWEYHDVLFANQDNLYKESLKEYAINIGLDKEQFSSCLDNEETKDIILVDLNDAERLNLKGTPTFFINGREVFGANQQEIEKIIKEELKNGKKDDV